METINESMDLLDVSQSQVTFNLEATCEQNPFDFEDDQPTQLDSADAMEEEVEENTLPQDEGNDYSQSQSQSHLPALSGVTIDDIFSDSDEEAEPAEEEPTHVLEEMLGSISDLDSSDEEDDKSSKSSSEPSSPASVKSVHSADPSMDAKKVKKSRKTKKVRSSEEIAAGLSHEQGAPTSLAVQAEIEAVKKLEQGPSEAELRRRAVIEIDEDELEEKIENLNKQGLRALQRATGMSTEERTAKLKECRAYLKRYLSTDEEDARKQMESFVEKHARRVFTADTNVDVWAYLDQDSYSDEEKEIKEEGEMVYLSDSEDDSPAPAARAPAPVAVPASAPIAPKGPMINHRPLIFDPSRIPHSARTSLLISLRQKVAQAAADHYCSSRHLSAGQLDEQIELSEKCRLLMVLLRDKADALSAVERAERIEKWAAEDDEEEEFEELPEGQYLTEEEKRNLLRQLAREAEEDEEEDDGYDGGYEAMDEDDAMEVDEALNEDDEEQEASAAKSKDEQQDMEDEDDGPRVSKKLKVQSQLDGEDKVDEDEEDGPKVARKARTQNADDEDDLPIRAQSIRSTVQDDDALVEDPASPASPVVSEVQQKTEAAPIARKSKGNLEYRMQLEEEERRLKTKKRSSLVDDEAEEEEEDGLQGGLQDFGFGTGNKEQDEERNALRLRKGDLDHIVDELGSDEEEDNLEAMAARAAMEAKSDRDRTRMIITAVTEGHDKLKAKKGYSFDKLVNGKQRVEGEAEAPDEEYDEEEMLQRGMEEKLERSRAHRAAHDSDSSDEDSMDEEDPMDLADLADLTEEQREIERENLLQVKAKERVELLKRKQRDQLMNVQRQKRRWKKEESASVESILDEKRVLADVTNTLNSRGSVRLLPGTHKKIISSARALSVAGEHKGPSKYKGELSKMEMGGLGMGMSESSIFSMVTAPGTGATIAKQRSFASHAVKPISQANALRRSATTSGHSFVFMPEASCHSRATMAAPSHSTMGANTMSGMEGSLGGSGGATGGGGADGKGSLFERLGAKKGSLKRSHSMIASK